jgi:hypothetical protein
MKEIKGLTPKKIATPKQRLVIYKKALKEIKANGKEEKHGLCILLKELANIKFMDLDLPETDELYPEFGNYINRYKPTKYLSLVKNNKPSNEWRIKVLKGCIKKCKK